MDISIKRPETNPRAEEILTELKNSLDVFKDIFEQAEERITEHTNICIIESQQEKRERGRDYLKKKWSKTSSVT